MALLAVHLCNLKSKNMHSTSWIRLVLLSLAIIFGRVGGGDLLGQEIKSPFVRSLWVGAHAGVDASRFIFVPRVAQRWYLAPSAGAMLRLDVERGASLQIETNWIRLGWTERYDDPNVSYTRSFTAVEFPILTHLYLGRQSFRLFVNAGPSLGYYLSEESVSQGEERFTPSQHTRHNLPLKNRLYWGLAGGLGFGVGIASRHRLELEGRFVYGFGDIWSSKRSDPYGQSSPMTIGARLNYLIKI